MLRIKFLVVVLYTAVISIHAQDFPKVEGWKVSGEVLKYTPDNLWEYINGAADQFIDYGFEALQAAELENGLIMVTADIYNMGLPLNAFGIYKTERPQDAKILDIGTEALISLPAQCLLLKDRYYVKIHLLKGELTEEKGKELLIALEKALPGNADFPDEFSLLPDKDQIKGSLGHVRRNFLGLSELNNCIYASYLSDEKTEFQYFALLPEANNTNEIIWDTIKNKWESTEMNGKLICYRKVPYKGYIGIVYIDSHLLGVTNASDINILMNRLKILYK